jgi:HPr kinase/phosphorylase
MSQLAQAHKIMDLCDKGDPHEGRLFCRATAVMIHGQGLLFLGSSGSGKSGLALELMTRGAKLISDDGVWLAPLQDTVNLIRPEQAPPLIEARYVGLLPVLEICADAPLRYVVDLDLSEPDRLPEPRKVNCFGLQFDLMHGRNIPNLAAVLDYLTATHEANPDD